MTEITPVSVHLSPLDRRSVEGRFDVSAMTSDAGVLWVYRGIGPQIKCLSAYTKRHADAKHGLLKGIQVCRIENLLSIF